MKLSKFAKVAAFVAMPLLCSATGVSAAITTQLGIAIDGSGSVNSSEFNTQRSGLANAFAALPIDGSVEITVVQFASSAQTEVAPVVIDSLATRNALVAQVNGISQTGGGTAPANAVNLLTSLMTGSAYFNGGAVDSIINLSTDGGFYLPPASASAVSAKAAGIDALTAEAIGPGANTTNLLAMVYNPTSNPGDGSAQLLATNATPPNPMTNPAWVVPVSDFNAFGAVINSKIQAIVTPGPVGVPEPETLLLLTVGLLGLFGSRRMSSNKMTKLAAA